MLSVWDEGSPLLMTTTSRKTRQAAKRRAPQSCLPWAELGDSAALRSFTYSLQRHRAFVWISLFRESCCVAQASLELAGLPPQPLQWYDYDSCCVPPHPTINLYLIAIKQPPDFLTGAVTVGEVPGEKLINVGPQITSFSVVPFSSTDFPPREQLRRSRKGVQMINLGPEEHSEASPRHLLSLDVTT